MNSPEVNSTPNPSPLDQWRNLRDKQDEERRELLAELDESFIEIYEADKAIRQLTAAPYDEHEVNKKEEELRNLIKASLPEMIAESECTYHEAYRFYADFLDVGEGVVWDALRHAQADGMYRLGFNYELEMQIPTDTSTQ